MKKIIALLLAIAMLLSMAACGAETPQNSDTQPGTSSTKAPATDPSAGTTEPSADATIPPETTDKPADSSYAIDLTGITIGDNGGDNSQVKEGSIKITLYAGAILTIKGYPNYTDYTLSDGTVEYVINKDSADHTAHSYTATSDVVVTITVTSGSNYFYGIEINYPVEPEEVTYTLDVGTDL